MVVTRVDLVEMEKGWRDVNPISTLTNLFMSRAGHLQVDLGHSLWNEEGGRIYEGLPTTTTGVESLN